MQNEHYLVELRRGTILIAVLSLLQNEEYGYNLIKLLNAYGFEIDSNTLYPLLRRLENQKILSSTTKLFEGRNRKYYLITNSGLELYELLIQNFNETNQVIQNITTRRIDE